jgi:hypothetical protein
MLAVALSSAGCASATGPVPLVRPTIATVTRAADLRLPHGADVIVRLVDGETVRGTLDAITGDGLELHATDAAGAIAPRRIGHGELALVARVVTVSNARRGWMGAAIAAAVSLPFGISMRGDMIVPAALLGAAIGRSSRHTRAYVVFERPCPPGTPYQPGQHTAEGCPAR